MEIQNDMKITLATVILEKENRILMGLRQNTKAHSGFWGFPGGRVEEGETPAQAAMREVNEEVGVVVEELFEPVIVTEHDSGNIFYVFRSTKWSGQPINREPNLCAKLEWFRLDQLPQNTIHECISSLKMMGLI